MRLQWARMRREAATVGLDGLCVAAGVWLLVFGLGLPVPASMPSLLLLWAGGAVLRWGVK
jgi:hypothetical protein